MWVNLAMLSTTVNVSPKGSLCTVRLTCPVGHKVIDVFSTPLSKMVLQLWSQAFQDSQRSLLCEAEYHAVQ